MRMIKMTKDQFQELLEFGGAFSELDETQRTVKIGFLYDFIFKEGLFSSPEATDSLSDKYLEIR